MQRLLYLKKQNSRVYPTSLPTNGQSITIIGSSNSGWRLQISANSSGASVWAFGVSFKSSQPFQYSLSTVVRNKWTHVCGSFDSAPAQLNLFVNRQLNNRVIGAVSSSSSNQLIDQSTTRLFIGDNTTDASSSFIGKLDQLRFYNESGLTLFDVDVDATTPIEETLVAAYSFDDELSTGGIVLDRSSYGATSRGFFLFLFRFDLKCVFVLLINSIFCEQRNWEIWWSIFIWQR